jgi:16S rRNA (cytidine1402-2'-O)-methyltransferase
VELTKKFERVSRGHLAELAAQFEGQTVRGEVTIVIAGNHPKFSREEPADPEETGDGPPSPPV